VHATSARSAEAAKGMATTGEGRFMAGRLYGADVRNLKRCRDDLPRDGERNLS
jgi:hypothetical protein